MVDTEQLGRAVIKQALSDAGIGAADNERRAVHPLDRDEARSFLLSQSG
jgi:beta-phosphoglucomutase-like phosphatase (HAD superfamily)